MRVGILTVCVGILTICVGWFDLFLVLRSLTVGGSDHLSVWGFGRFCGDFDRLCGGF